MHGNRCLVVRIGVVINKVGVRLQEIDTSARELVADAATTMVGCDEQTTEEVAARTRFLIDRYPIVLRGVAVADGLVIEAGD